jgi:Tol biopolymer transport system component
MYFGSDRSGMMQIYKSYRDRTGVQVAEALPPPINVRSYEGDPCIAPDGRFIVFYSCREGSHGGADLYVGFDDGQGGWRTPVNLGDAFNKRADQFGAHLSSDGNYLFFTRHGPGGNEINWVSVSAIDKLRG